MGRREVLAERIEDVKKYVLAPLEEELREIWKNDALTIDERVALSAQGRGDFKADELRFAATTRCSCGAGLAYPLHVSPMRGVWLCSDILMGKAIAKGLEGSKTHRDGFPFVTYEIKSEGQPSANGQTTRPEEVKS